MIIGHMRSLTEAVVDVSIRGSMSLGLSIEAIIDTGFSEYLTLPSALITELGLARTGTITVVLADRTRKLANAYRTSVMLSGEWITVDIEESEGDIILGMGLLQNCRLFLEVTRDGNVTIEEIE